MLNKVRAAFGLVAREESGLELIEIGLIAALIIVAVLAIMKTMGSKLFNVFKSLNGSLDENTQPAQ